MYSLTMFCVPGMKTIVWSISHCHDKRDKVIMPSYFYLFENHGSKLNIHAMTLRYFFIQINVYLLIQPPPQSHAQLQQVQVPHPCTLMQPYMFVGLREDEVLCSCFFRSHIKDAQGVTANTQLLDCYLFQSELELENWTISS